MDQKKSMLDMEDIMFGMLENLKSNGTFDEFRRHCISDIDAKPTYQNWKQRIESNVKKFLSKVVYTPELNKNTIRERLRKHLLDGREALDIEEGADRVVSQLLVPRTLSGFEPKLAMAVNEFLGIKNQTPPKEQNGLKESSNNLKNISRVEMGTIVSNSKRDFASEADNVENVDEDSPEFEPLSSVLDNDNSNDESVSGMSDLASVGSPVQLVSKENHDTTSNGFESDKNLIEKPLLEKLLSDVNGITNHKNDSTNNKPDDVPKILNNTEKLKTNNSKPPKSKHSSKASVHSSSQEKSSSHRSKDRNSNSHRSSSREKNVIKKKSSSSSSSSKDRKISNNSKHHSSNSKDKKHKHDKKSHHSDRDKTPKRDRKDSRSDKKEKSSSLCKEPKLLNGNRSDDDNNAGGSSKQKSNLLKNKSSTSDKSKSSSSNHKSSKKNNSSKEVVDKSKDRSSVSKNSSTSGQKSSQKNTKSHKRSIGEKNKLDTNNSNVEEKKPKLTDLRSSNITNDEQDAVNILLSISEIPYESPHKDIIPENMLAENVSLAIEIQKIPFNITENELEIPKSSNQTEIPKNSNETEVPENSDQTQVPENSDQTNVPENSNQTKVPKNSNQTEVPENSNQTKIPSNNDNVKENVNVQTYKSGTNSYDSLCETKIIKFINHSLENVCSVDIERHPLLCKDQKLQNSSVQNNIITEHNQLAKDVINEIEEKSLNHEINLNSSDTQNNCSEHGSNENLKVPKLKLKRLPDHKNSIENNKRRKHHKNDETKIKKLKKSKSYVLSCGASVPVMETASTMVVCKNNEQESNCGPDIKINDPVTTLSNKLLYRENENKSTPAMDDEECTFKGFSETDVVQCKSYYHLKDLIKSLQQKINDQIEIENAGFRGFTDVRPCEKRNVLHSKLIELRENLGFRGFSDEEVQFSPKHKLVKEQLELAIKQNNYKQKTMPSGKNVIQNGKKINDVVAIVYESNDDNPGPGEVCTKKKNENGKKDCPAVNNNNHDITTTEEWVVEQEMKYKLLPVKVKIERLLEIRHNGTMYESNSSQVPSAPQRSKFK